jgi:acyl-CoA thioesterase-1
MTTRRTLLFGVVPAGVLAQAEPRVLLIGDSISIGYAPAVRKLLDGKANVHLIPANGGPTANGLQNLSAWLGEGRWDVIHFNWGLHDLRIMADGAHQAPIEAYEKNLGELVARLKTTGAKLIWCSTTPVPEGKLSPPRRPADVPRYNEIAARIMQANGIAINDLYAFALPRLARIQRPENVHFTEAGSEQLAQTVAEAVLQALG